MIRYGVPHVFIASSVSRTAMRGRWTMPIPDMAVAMPVVTTTWSFWWSKIIDRRMGRHLGIVSGAPFCFHGRTSVLPCDGTLRSEHRPGQVPGSVGVDHPDPPNRGRKQESGAVTGRITYPRDKVLRKRRAGEVAAGASLTSMGSAIMRTALVGSSLRYGHRPPCPPRW